MDNALSGAGAVPSEFDARAACGPWSALTHDPDASLESALPALASEKSSAQAATPACGEF